ncbi:hypothetical protein FRX31_010653 [Thalictrum thalictroides]|uniref:Uncharacterized protein n=1 Tax=Thalictrum thalictroides TaxID=46969 RepID=A0A7J6WQW0_THATH|nr:hypothetical protein FRX31_010653 [Thalictrum thalictroides]
MAIGLYSWRMPSRRFCCQLSVLPLEKGSFVREKLSLLLGKSTKDWALPLPLESTRDWAQPLPLESARDWAQPLPLECATDWELPLRLGLGGCLVRNFLFFYSFTSTSWTVQIDAIRLERCEIPCFKR